MSHRVPPRARLRLQRLDLMLVAAMLVVTVSYALGYRLDWRQEQGLSLGAAAEEEEESMGAQIPAPAAATLRFHDGRSLASAPGRAPSPAPVQTAIVPAAPLSWTPNPSNPSGTR